MPAMDPNKDGGQSTLLSSRDLPMFISRFEDMTRRCVRGVLQELSLSINLPPQPLPDPSIQARYRLQFINKVKDTTFTTDLVRDENENPIKVAIYDMYASQKPDRLKLTHKIQSLKKVGKYRASLLQQKNINTVKDFLKLYYNDEPALREILCIKSESDKGWKSMVKHAMQCADEFQAKYNDLNNSSQPRQALVHMPGRTVSLQTNGGPFLVGSGSSVPNPCENNLLIPACE